MPKHFGVDFSITEDLNMELSCHTITGTFESGEYTNAENDKVS